MGECLIALGARCACKYYSTRHYKLAPSWLARAPKLKGSEAHVLDTSPLRRTLGKALYMYSFLFRAFASQALLHFLRIGSDRKLGVGPGV